MNLTLNGAAAMPARRDDTDENLPLLLNFHSRRRCTLPGR